MPLKVFYGPFQPELEDAFIEALKANPPGLARRVAVVAPSRRLADRLQRLIGDERGLSLLNVRFHTFFSLALEIMEESGSLDKTVVADGLFHDRIVDRLLRGSGAGRLSRGTAAAYRSSLRDLVDAGVEPAQFREHFGGLLEEKAAARLESLLALQEKYQEALRRLSLVAPSGLARLAAAALGEGRAAGLKRYAEVFYYGFYDLTGAQTDFFSAVAQECACTVFFPYRKDHPAFQFAKRFFDLKLSQGKTQGLDGGSRQGLGEGLECLFTPGRQAAPAAVKGLEIINAAGRRDEAWAVAKRILRLREQEGVDFSAIGVVARVLDPYRAVLTQVLRENAIPFSMGAAQPLLRHPIAKLCLSLLTLRRADFPAGAVTDVFDSPYFLPPGGAGRVAAAWRRLIERVAVHSGWLQWVGKVSPWARKDFELHAQDVKEGRGGVLIRKEDSARLWAWLEDLHARLDPEARRSWAAHGAHAKNLLELNFDAGEEPLPAWGKTLEMIAELEVFSLIEAQCPWREFVEVLEEKMRRATLEAGPANRGVRVLDAMDARGESFRALFLVGLTEGFFPRQVREDPLLGDGVRARLRHPAGYWIGPKLEGYEEEKLLFALLAWSAREKLVCVYSRSDEDGRAQIPSVYLRELCRACGVDFDGPANTRVARQPFAKIESLPAESLSPKETSLLMAREGIAAGPFLDPLGKDSPLFDGCLERVALLRRSGEPAGMDGIVGAPAEFLAENRRRGLSPTALDSFSQCPFQFFAARVLGLREAAEPAPRGELSAALRGTIYHRILERFYSELLKDGFWRRPDDSWKESLALRVSEVFGEFGWKELGLYPVLWESAKRRMSFHLDNLARRDVQEIGASGMIPSFFEHDLKATVDSWEFRGTADRIDKDAEGRRFRVVDYKSTWGSWKGALEKRVLAMRAHQPPLYLELFERTSPVGAAPLGASYYILEESPEMTGAASIQEFGARAWKAARGGIWANIRKFVAQIERGEFFIVPDDSRAGACSYCDFQRMCRKSHPASRRRAESSGLRSAFDEAHEVGP